MARRSSAVGFCLALALCMAAPCLATDYTVGDTGGWAMGVDYTTWTSDKTFKVGDNLVFKYGGGHTVDEVTKSDYSSCTTGNSISTDSSGATTVPLKIPGTHYFICAAMGHCSGGMKLAVDVTKADDSGTPVATPTAAAPTSSSTPTLGNGNTNSSSATTNVDNSSVAASPQAVVAATLFAFFIMVFY